MKIVLMTILVVLCESRTDILQSNDISHFTAHPNETILLPCLIKNRQQSTIIWQYYEPSSNLPQTLTINNLQYSQDYRIRVIFSQLGDDTQSWSLEVRRLKHDDEGYYVCRVLNGAGSDLKKKIHLKILPRLVIKHNYDLNSIKLFCLSSLNGRRDQLKWYHNKQPLNNNSIKYSIDFYQKTTLISVLKIHNINFNDFGEYTCSFKGINASFVFKKHTNDTLAKSSSSRIYFISFLYLLLVIILFSG